MIPRSWRVAFFNWLGAGKVKLTVDKTQEYTNMGYTLNAGATNWNNSVTLGPTNISGHDFKNTITIRVTPANGGHIVSVNADNHTDELHIIPEGTDFDRELGKIITLNRLKA